MSDRPRILIIEDDWTIIRALSIRLKAAEFEIEEAHDGESGIEAAIARTPDLIVLDMRMPDISGADVLEQLKASPATADIPVVILTSSTSSDSRERAFAAGANCYLTKPYNPAHVLTVIKTTLANHEKVTLDY